MINKDKIIVIKNKQQVIISFDGCKLIKPIEGFENLSEEDIKIWFINELNMT